MLIGVRVQAPAVPLLLVDGYRSWFGFPGRIRARSGRDLTGVFGFLALLRKAVREHAPGHEIVVVFDSETGAMARQRVDPAYKAARRVADHAPRASYDDLCAVLDLAGVRWLEPQDTEADDVIGSLAAAHDRAVVVLSSDKDFHQLVSDPRVRQLDTRQRVDRRWITAATVRERYGVEAGRWPDLRALTGDPSDGIPGARGIGPKTAAMLLQLSPTLEALRPLLAGHRLGVVRQAAQRWDDVLRWRDLITLDPTVDVPTGLSTAEATPELPPAAELVELAGLW